MPIPRLTEAKVREHTAEGSFERGERYFEDGAVQQIDVYDEKVEAHVRGSAPLPYVVTVRYNDDGIKQANCTCPYHEGSWCKHIVAVLLAHLQQNEHEQINTIRSIVSDMSRAELVSLIERLAERDRRVRKWVEEEQAA